jgi:hypothetical protein
MLPINLNLLKQGAAESGFCFCNLTISSFVQDSWRSLLRKYVGDDSGNHIRAKAANTVRLLQGNL